MRFLLLRKSNSSRLTTTEPATRSLRWRMAALLLGALAFAPLVVSGAGSAAVKVVLTCGAIGFVAVLGMRAKDGRAAAPRDVALIVVARSSLSQRTGLAVVEFGTQRLLVGFGDGFLQVLSRSPARRSGKKA